MALTAVKSSDAAAPAIAAAARLIAAAALRARERGDPPPPVVMDIDDTLISDRRTYWAAQEDVIRLFHLARGLGLPVHLITARLDDAETRAMTVDQLRALHADDYASLRLLPEEDRASPVHVSAAKARLRSDIAKENNTAVALTVGDQWSDATVLASEEHFDELDGKFTTRYTVGRCNDGICAWFLKLPENSGE